MFSTLQEAMTQVARHMSLVNGRGMTPYSPDLIISYLHGAHVAIRDEQEWSEWNVSHIRTLDGVTGRITLGITDVADWKDIQRLYHESSMTPLPKVTQYNNPLISVSMNGYSGLARSDDPGPSYNLVQFYPLILTGRVLFQAKATFDFATMDLVLPVDWWLHVYHASWQYALDDGTNPPQMTKYERLYNDRLKQVKAKENARPLSMDPYAAIPDLWFEGNDPYWIGS